MSKKRTKGFTIKRAVFMAQKLKEQRNRACSVEAVIWSWEAKGEEVSYQIYSPGKFYRLTTWSELEDKFAELTATKERPKRPSKGD